MRSATNPRVLNGCRECRSLPGPQVSSTTVPLRDDKDSCSSAPRETPQSHARPAPVGLRSLERRFVGPTSRSFVNSVVAYIPVESILHVMQVFNLEQIARSASMNNRIASEATRLTRKYIKVPSTLDTLSLNCCHFL